MRLLPLLWLALLAFFGPSGPPRPPAHPAAAPEDDLLAKLRNVRLDPSAVYKVRDLNLAREDIRFYFTDGQMALMEAVDGRVTGALFVGEAEILLMPPNATEKRNLARFTGSPVLAEKFTSAYLRFTDDTGALLEESLRQGQQRLDGGAFAEEWNSVILNLNLMYDLRTLMDLLYSAPGPPAVAAAGTGARAGRPARSVGSAGASLDVAGGQARPEPAASPTPFFGARIFGQRLGAFDLGVDYRLPEQVMVGQTNWKDGRRYADLWCSFPARSVRSGARAPADPPVRPKAYRLESTIRSDRELEVNAELELEAITSGERLLTFELSQFLRLTSVESGGQPVRYVQEPMRDESDARRRGNDLVAVILPEPLEKGRRYRLRFHYSGEVISDAGRGVLFVGSRGSWYPNRGFAPAEFDLTFRYPRRLRLVATGRRLEETEEGEWRISRWKSPGPIRVAGFNIGDYEEAQAKAGDGTVVEVHANRALEPALEAQRAPSILVDPDSIPPFPGRRRNPPVTFNFPPPPPSPAVVAAQIARDTAQVVDYFTRIFGPLPFGRVAISPIPGSFGQGWPGLVYLSTSSFLLPFERTRRPLPQAAELYYRTLLRDHELAHQWWGHVVAPASYHDEWVTEALAGYGALLALENQGRTGQQHAHLLLERYRDDLLAKQEEETREAVGPPVLGFRLISSRSPHGWDDIFYKKGPWIIHMLRHLMRDPKTGSDAAFFQFLHALREQFSDKPITTEGFRAVAEKFVLPERNAEDGRSLEWFFDEWVYGTGIPEIHIKASVEASRRGTAARSAPVQVQVKVQGTGSLTGVDDSWVLPVPIYVQTARGEVFAGTAVLETGESKFSFSLAVPVQKVVVDPQQTLLAVWR